LPNDAKEERVEEQKSGREESRNIALILEIEERNQPEETTVSKPVPGNERGQIRHQEDEDNTTEPLADVSGR
jgi:hypothetical protein